MTDVDDLIKRLRENAQHHREAAHMADGLLGYRVNLEHATTDEEAADALHRMKEALEPFANRADEFDKMIVGEIKPSLVHDCQAARRALRGEGT